jgi:PAS domain S-box-containing protein
MWSVDKNYNLITSNRAFVEMIKSRSGKIIKKGDNLLSDFYNEEQLANYKQYYDRAFSGATFTESEHTIKPFEHWSEISFYPIGEGATIVGAACYAYDTTEKKKAEALLRQTEDTQRQIMESAMGAIVCIDEAGRITFWNSRAEKMFGWLEDDIIGLRLTDTIIPPRHQKAHTEGLNHHRTTGTGAILNKIIEVRALNKEGKEFPVELTVIPIHESGRLTYCAFIQDISERKIAEQKVLNTSSMYSFISQMNQAIVHADNEQSMYAAACAIAIKFGKFSMAWICKIETPGNKIHLIEQCGLSTEDAALFTDISYEKNGPINQVLKTGSYYLCNDIELDFALPGWKTFISQHGLRSCMVFPIKRSGEIVGMINLYSKELNYFDADEIAILEEATGNISFALDVFEKEKYRVQAEEKLTHNELRFNQAQAIAQGAFQIVAV